MKICEKKLLMRLIESVLELELYPDLYEDEGEETSDPGTRNLDIKTIATNIPDDKLI